MRLSQATLVICALAACSTDTDISDRPLFPDGFIVFQAVVLDGLTGDAVDPVDLRVQIGHHVLPSELDNGIHVVYGLPDNTGVFVLADADGYAPFVAKVTIDGTGNLATGDLDYRFFNVLMYPVGTSPSDVTVSVFTADGTPVDGATVVATLDQQPVFVPVDTPLFPGVGILPGSVVAQTANGGKATFAGADLVLGAEYSIDVFGALDANGVFLVPSQNNTIRIGSQVPEIVVFLDRPQLAPVAISANNEDGAIHGNLTVRFPYAVDVCSLNTEHTWFASGGDTDFDGNVAAPVAINPVTLTKSTGDTTLALEENYGTGLQAFDPNDNLFVTFNGVRLKPRGAGDASCRALSSVELRDTNRFVSTQIHVNQP